MRPADIIAHAIPTSLGKLSAAEWLSIWRTWARSPEQLARRLGRGWAIDERLGNFPLIGTRSEALERVGALVCREAMHRAALALTPFEGKPHDWTCDQCDDAWPFDPARLVVCPDCGADIGHPCKRPSGHPLFANSFHASREPAAMAAGLLQRCKAAPMPEITRQPALF